MSAALKKDGVPLTLLSFQGGWWRNPNLHTPRCAPWCVTSWEANTTKVPLGVAAFHERLGLPLQLYAPYFCDDNVYDARNGGAWVFIDSDVTLPGCAGYSFRNVAPDSSHAFYTQFLQFGRERGMVAFEPDFLRQNYQCLPPFRRNVSAAPTWMGGMAAAAAAMEPPVAIQFCMATPNDLLAALDYPAAIA